MKYQALTYLAEDELCSGPGVTRFATPPIENQSLSQSDLRRVITSQRKEGRKTKISPISVQPGQKENTPSLLGRRVRSVFA